MNCNDIRELLALQPSIDDTSLQQHLDQCLSCAGYRRRHQALDGALRAELHWQVPAALATRLLALASAPAEVQPLESAARPEIVAHGVVRQATLSHTRPRPRGWYVAAVYILTAAVIALSLLVALQLFGELTAQVSIGAALTQLYALPAQGLSYLTQTLPESRFLIDFFLRVRDQLMWLLLIAVLWAALDKWPIPLSFGGSRQTS